MDAAAFSKLPTFQSGSQEKSGRSYRPPEQIFPPVAGRFVIQSSYRDDSGDGGPALKGVDSDHNAIAGVVVKREFWT